jgi:hypothetical protein
MLFDLWLLNSQDSSRYVHVGMFGDLFDTRRSWYFQATGEPFVIPDFSYSSDTWFKLRVTQLPGENLEVSIWNDCDAYLLAGWQPPSENLGTMPLSPWDITTAHGVRF